MSMIQLEAALDSASVCQARGGIRMSLTVSFVGSSTPAPSSKASKSTSVPGTVDMGRVALTPVRPSV